LKAGASTGVVPELIKQLKHPIMLRVMYKNDQLPINLASMLENNSDLESLKGAYRV
jgi:hypothetical protein